MCISHVHVIRKAFVCIRTLYIMDVWEKHAPAFNPLKLSGCIIYHQVLHPEIIHSAHTFPNTALVFITEAERV